MLDTLEICDAVLFRNAEWEVSARGLEHRGTGYEIAREGIDRRRGPDLWDWPLHMAEKGWCTPSLFREAFLVALDRFGLSRDAALAESFALGFGIRAGRSSASAEAGFALLADLVRSQAGARRPNPAAAAPRSSLRQRRFARA